VGFDRLRIFITDRRVGRAIGVVAGMMDAVDFRVEEAGC